MSSQTAVRAQQKAGVELNRQGGRVMVAGGTNCRHFGESRADGWKSGKGRWAVETVE